MGCEPMNGDQITVVVTTFNRKQWVERAVRSVLEQTRPADEIIVVDDGSTDGTGTRIQKRFPQVRYIRQENQGISAARNHGIENGTGSWFGFLDSDDIWLPKKLESQIRALQDNPEYRICHTNEIWIRRGKRVNPKKVHQKSGGDLFEKCLPLCLISPSSILMHREIFDRVGLFDPELPVCEDYDLWLRVSAYYPVLYIEEPLIVKYGGHADQLSRKYWGMDRFRIAALEKLIASEYLDNRRRTAALQMIVHKIRIFLNGARKRDKEESIAVYQEKFDHYQERLVDLTN
jgi:glycosyltransferase involved in cell wall biosynthesis